MDEIKLQANNICVDAGLIILCDEAWLENNYSDVVPEQDLYSRFDIEPGEYNISVYIEHTWEGEINDFGVVEITSGTMIVTDPCYWYDDHTKWTRILDETDYFENEIPGIMVVNSMGGDGVYDLSLVLTKCLKD